MKYFDVIKTVKLFSNIEAHNFEAMLSCLQVQTVGYKKDEIVLLAGSKPEYVGIVLAGQLHVMREDYDGKRTLLAAISPGEMFAEALCCAGVSESPVTVAADTDSAVMLLSFSRILSTCSNSCSFHAKLIENMLWIVANKNLQLQGRIEVIGLRSVRAKLLRYLESFAPKQGEYITVPFNREELADFLCVERSALSHELSRMKADGLLDYKKNKFLLKNLH